MTSGVENICVDPSLLVSEYPEEMSVEVSEYRSVEVEEPDFTPAPETTDPQTYAQNSCESPQAYSGAECTPDTYVDASDFTPVIKPAGGKALHASRFTHDASDVPTVELSDFGPLAPVVAVVALVLGGLGASCGPSSGGGGNGDGGFQFGGEDGGGDDDMTMPVDDPNDVDGDGYPEDKDCDDTDASVHPRATETPYDGIDQDCNGEDVIDADNDGFIATQAGGDDCNDDQAYIHPGAEQRLTGFDTNCDDSLEIDLARGAVTFVGENEEDVPGHHSVAIGDLNGDGYDDIALGLRTYNYSDGKVYIFFGNEGDLTPGAGLDVTDADVKIIGNCDWFLGAALYAKDLDDDGKAELLVGAPGFNGGLCDGEEGDGDGSRTGALLVFSGRDEWESVYDFNVIDAFNVSELSALEVGLVKGPERTSIGERFFVTGDIDGNGEGEIVAGRGSQCNVIPARAYTGIQNIVDIRNTEGGYYFYDNTGSPFNGNHCDNVASGDVNGDGFGDLAFGNTADDVHATYGEVVLIMGGASLPTEMNFYTASSYSGLKHLVFEGNVGQVAAAGGVTMGDLNADGKDEVLIASNGEDDPMSNAGRVYCLPGSVLGEVVDGENPLFGNGARITLNGDVYDLGGKSFHGDVENAQLPAIGLAASSDTNGDGAKDLVVGSGRYGVTSGATPGRTFYFDGLPHSTSADQEISVAASEHEISGKEPNNFGYWITGGGDVNGDGAQDIVINAPGTAAANNQGKSYLLFGGSR